MLLLTLLACAGFRHQVEIPAPLPPPLATLPPPAPLEHVEISQARDMLVLKAALPAFAAGFTEVEIQVVTGITDATGPGQDGWLTCAEFDPWLLGFSPDVQTLTMSEKHLPCDQDPTGYVTTFLAAGYLGMRVQVPVRVSYDFEGLRFQVTDQQVVPVEWLIPP